MPTPDTQLRDLARLRRVRDRIDRDYARPLDVEALAGGIGMSAGHLSRQFRAAYGESVYAYPMTRRIERAMALLRRGDLSVTEVCFEVGCSLLSRLLGACASLIGTNSAYKETAMRSALSRTHIACRPAWGGPAPVRVSCAAGGRSNIEN